MAWIIGETIYQPALAVAAAVKLSGSPCSYARLLDVMRNGWRLAMGKQSAYRDKHLRAHIAEAIAQGLIVARIGADGSPHYWTAENSKAP